MADSIRVAIHAREEELRVLIQAREEEVAAANARREEEIIASVNAREKEFCDAWREREEAMEERIRWCQSREQDLAEEERRVNAVREEVEERMAEWSRTRGTGRTVKDEKTTKTPFEEVKNVLEPLNRLPTHPCTPGPPKLHPRAFPTPGSAMKGVVLTATGEILNTPAPSALFAKTPKVVLNFAKIFDFEDDENVEEDTASPSQRRNVREATPTSLATSSATPTSSVSSSSAKPPPTRLRRPSITRPDGLKGGQSQPLPHPHLRSPVPATYDLADEENLPSPFLKRTERAASSENLAGKAKKRPSSGNLLRAVAAANSAVRSRPSGAASTEGTRSSVANARKASDEARKALFRT